MKKPNPFIVTKAHLARARCWPIGQAVAVTRDDGTIFETTTRSGPWQLGDTWVVMVEGISGGYALARVVEKGERSVDDRQPKRSAIAGDSTSVR